MNDQLSDKFGQLVIGSEEKESVDPKATQPKGDKVSPETPIKGDKANSKTTPKGGKVTSGTTPKGVSQSKSDKVNPETPPKDDKFSPETTLEADPTTPLKNFWPHCNINVKYLNDCSKKKEERKKKETQGKVEPFTCVRLEKYPPCIYAVVLTDAVKRVDKKPSNTEWVLVKVGFTQQRDSVNRSEQVKNEVEKSLQENDSPMSNVNVLGVWKQSSIDTSLIREVEERARKKLGRPVPKDKIKELGLPFITEWVLTNKCHADIIVEMLDNVEDTSALTGTKFSGSLPDEGVEISVKDITITLYELDVQKEEARKKELESKAEKKEEMKK